MSKLFCKLFGHRRLEWRSGVFGWAFGYCTRCKRVIKTESIFKEQA